MWKLHEASSLTNHEEVESWLSKSLDRKEEPQSANKFIPLSKQSLSGRNLSETILQRGSTRKFAREPVNFEQLSEILHVSTSKLPVDYSTYTPLLDIFFIANSVTGIASASYQFHTDSHSIEQLKTVESRRTSAYLSLEQPLFGDASVVFYLMADLDQFLSKLGNRGYRIAQLEGGIIAGKIYLASYALGLGASGSTFYDDAVTEFFMPNTNGKSPIIEVAVGVPGYKAKPGMILPQFM
jgi:SagB-type dehydrogenase family enzyme